MSVYIKFGTVHFGR